MLGPHGGFPASPHLLGTTSSPSCSPCLGPRPASRPHDTRTSPSQSRGFLCPGAGAAPLPSSESVPHPSSLVVPVGRTRALCVFWGAPPGLAGTLAWLCWPPCPFCPPSHGRQASELCASPAPELLSCTRPPQQLPDLPPHLPPARPPGRPHQARPLQRHLRQPWPGDRHAQLPWDACQGHQDHSESGAALAAPLRDLRLLGCGSCASGCTLATQSGRPCPGECAGGADCRAPPTPTEPGLAFPKTSRELRAFPRWLYPWLSVLATHGIPGDVEKTLMLGPRDSDSMGSAPWTVQYGHIGDLLHYYTCPLPSWPERLTNTVWRAVELNGGLEEIGRWACSRTPSHCAHLSFAELRSWGVFPTGALKCPGEQCLFLVLTKLCSWTLIGQGPCALGRLLVCGAQHWGPGGAAGPGGPPRFRLRSVCVPGRQVWPCRLALGGCVPFSKPQCSRMGRFLFLEVSSARVPLCRMSVHFPRSLRCC